MKSNSDFVNGESLVRTNTNIYLQFWDEDDKLEAKTYYSEWRKRLLYYVEVAPRIDVNGDPDEIVQWALAIVSAVIEKQKEEFRNAYVGD